MPQVTLFRTCVGARRSTPEIAGAVDKLMADGAAVDGVAVGGVALDGIAVDGIAVDGIAVDGIAVDGPVFDEPAALVSFEAECCPITNAPA